MATYDLKCNDCKNISEQKQNKDVACPKCGGDTYQTFENWGKVDVHIPLHMQAINDSKYMPDSVVFTPNKLKAIAEGRIKKVGRDDY